MSNITIKTSELLWRTKGLNWEYSFVLLPEIDRGSWWRFYREVKAKLDFSQHGDQALGTLIDREGNEHPYIASAVLDSVHLDSAGRETEQFVVWFPKENQESCLPVNLAGSVAEQMEPFLNSKKMRALSDSDSDSPAEILKDLLPAGHTFEVKTSSTAPRSLGIDHQLEADLATVASPKKNHLKSIILMIAFLIGALLVLYFSGITP